MKSRNCSRSLSLADKNPHDPAPTTECPAFPRDHISRYADDDDEFNSHFEDHQDLAPEDETHNVFEIHSNVSSEDMRFQNFIEEVFSFFFWPTSSQRKQMRFWEGTGCDLTLKWKSESPKEKYFFATIKMSFD